MRVQRYDFLLKVRPFAPAFNLYLNYFLQITFTTVTLPFCTCAGASSSAERLLSTAS